MKVSTRKIDDMINFKKGRTIDAPNGELIVESSFGQKIRIQEEDGMFEIRTVDGVFVLEPSAQNVIKLFIVEHYGDLENAKRRKIK